MSVPADTSRPQVLCIAGSPRRHGNSDRLLDEVEAGVRDAGGEPVRLVASEAGIAPCLGCNACSKSGVCAVRDGMSDVYPLLDAASAIVIATPVYFASVPATLKALYDRCQPYWARRYVLGAQRREVRRPGALLVVGGGGDPFGLECAVTVSRSVLNVLEVALDELLEVVGPDAAGDVVEDAAAMARAREIGRAVSSRAAATPPSK